MFRTKLVVVTLLGAIYALRSAKTMTFIEPEPPQHQSADNYDQLVIDSSDNNDDDPCWRKYSGYLYVYENETPKLVPAWVNGSKLNLAANIIPLASLALPILPMANDPRCFKLMIEDFPTPLSMCCATMQCKTQWIIAITKSRFCNALMLGAAAQPSEEEESAALEAQPSAEDDKRPKGDFIQKGESGIVAEPTVGQKPSAEDFFDEYLFVIRPATGQFVEIDG